MKIDLTDDEERIVSDAVSSGRCENVEQAVAEALRFWGSGTAVAFRHNPTVEELHAAQGTRPMNDLAALGGDFWPAGESTEQFLAWLDEERGGGGRPDRPSAGSGA